MDCSKFEYSNHAVAQMFKRSISADEVESAAGRPIHVVVSQDISNGVCYIITAYEPDIEIWETNFKNKL